MDVALQKQLHSESFLAEDTLSIVNAVLQDIISTVDELLKSAEARGARRVVAAARDLDVKEWHQEKENEDNPELSLSSDDYVDAMEDVGAESLLRDIDSATENSVQRQINPVIDAARELENVLDNNVDSSADDSPLIVNSSDSDDSDDYRTAVPSEDVGDRHDFDNLDDMHFFERMLLYFREADLITESNRGSGDHPVIDSSDDDSD